LRVNADTVVSDNSTAGWGHFKFFSSELQYGCERCIIGNSDTKNIT
jgi:hypothetical protein